MMHGPYTYNGSTTGSDFSSDYHYYRPLPPINTEWNGPERDGTTRVRDHDSHSRSRGFLFCFGTTQSNLLDYYRRGFARTELIIYIPSFRALVIRFAHSLPWMDAYQNHHQQRRSCFATCPWRFDPWWYSCQRGRPTIFPTGSNTTSYTW